MMMMMAAKPKTAGGATQMLNGVGDLSEAPLKRDEAEFGPLGVRASPQLGSGPGGGELECH